MRRALLRGMLLALAVSACKAGTYDSPGDIPVEPGASHWGLGLGVTGAGSMYATRAVTDALSRVRRRRAGTDELPVSTVDIFETYLSLVAQGTKYTTDRDGFRVDIDGDVKVTPYASSGPKGDAELFDADTVAWDKIPEMTRQTLSVLHIDGAVVKRVSVRRYSLGAREVRITVSCSSVRHSGDVTFDAHGKQLTFSAR